MPWSKSLGDHFRSYRLLRPLCKDVMVNTVEFEKLLDSPQESSSQNRLSCLPSSWLRDLRRRQQRPAAQRADENDICAILLTARRRSLQMGRMHKNHCGIIDRTVAYNDCHKPTKVSVINWFGA